MTKRNEEMSDLSRLRRRVQSWFRNRTFTTIFILSNIYFLYNYNILLHTFRFVNGQRKHLYKSQPESFIYNNVRFSNALDLDRINRLFEILQRAEINTKPTRKLVDDEVLKLISFVKIKEILAHSEQGNVEFDSYYDAYSEQINAYLKVNRHTQMIEATEAFGQYLTNISIRYTIKQPRTKIIKKKVDPSSDVPVLLLAANYKYFHPLMNSLQILKRKFPKFPIIIYDLGMTSSMRKEILKKYSCDIRFFDSKKRLKAAAPHVDNLINYSWKPLLIQEVLLEYKTIFYIDTSIKILSNEINSILNTTREIGIMARYLPGFDLPCFTDSRMFAWFKETDASFAGVYTAEANFIILHRSFLTSLIMKAWVTCAMDEACIAPHGAHIYGGLVNYLYGCSVCGCHRFDQDALSISLSYFFAIPEEKSRSPAYALTMAESFFTQ